MIRLLLSVASYLCISFNLSATLYSEDEINATIRNEVVKQSSKEFVRKFFTTKNPFDYIENFTNSHLSDNELLILEHQLYTLLNEISYQSKQQFLQDFVNEMKLYQPQAYRLNNEGMVEVPIYNIQARAKGIENIWQASASVNHYSAIFEDDPVFAINDLRNKIENLSTPQWLGLKNSIKNLSIENRQKISDYFMADVNHIKDLERYVSHFGLLSADKVLLAKSLLHMDKSNVEYILRSMSQYFSTDFVTKMLVATVNNNKNQAFALSLMNTYVDTHSEIKQLLFDYLKHVKFSSNAAFALSYTQNVETLKQLKDRYFNSESNRERKQIIFCLQMNKSKFSKVILGQLRVHDKDPTNNVWLNQFNGGSK